MDQLSRVSIAPLVRFGKPCVRVLRGPPPKVIWLSIGNASNAMTSALLLQYAEIIEAFVADAESGFLALRVDVRTA